ncbi:MAG: hypothetical protein ABIK81_03850 [candidate division WOR-3 bacterium]
MGIGRGEVRSRRMGQEAGGRGEEETGRGNRKERRKGRERKSREEKAKGIREGTGKRAGLFYSPGMP